MIAKGLLLHTYVSGETSKRLIFFTQQYGIISTYFKGATRSKKNSLLQPFLPVWLYFNNEQAAFLQNIEPAAAHFELAGKSLFAGLYLNELLFYCLKSCDPHPNIYNRYYYALQALTVVDNPSALESILRSFEWWLLHDSGYQLNSLPIQLDACYTFQFGKGFTQSTQGITGYQAQEITEGNFTDLEVLRVAKPLFRQAIDRLLNGRVLKSRSLFVRTFKA